jgi:antitoxin component HigA of HigAB toxin-antitoxin module
VKDYLICLFGGDFFPSFALQPERSEEIVMSAIFVRETHAAYLRLRRFVPFGVLRSEKDYRKAVASLDEILDEIGQDEAHPLTDLAEALAVFIHSYEETHAKIPEATGPEVLRSLMETHGLTQSDLPEINSQGLSQKSSPANANSTFDRSAAWPSDSGCPLPSSSPAHETRREGPVPMPHALSCQ